MGRLKLKVCGMRNLANVGEIGTIRPDYVGFIFYQKSPRYVGLNFSLATENFTFEPVGVFVNETTDSILSSLKNIGSTIAQLHGDESPDDCKKLRDNGIRVIKAIPVGNVISTSELKKYNRAVDYFLFDTKGKLYGGNSARFDWNLLDTYQDELPFLLSGGIRIEDLNEVPRIANPRLYGIDINSGVEASPGLKDPSLVRRVKEAIDNI
jgi:phosphoribosylanthranilate isomerase